MIVTIKVEYEGSTPKYDLGIQEKLSLETVRDAKTDIVCEAIYRMVDMINKARRERTNAGHTGANP